MRRFGRAAGGAAGYAPGLHGPRRLRPAGRPFRVRFHMRGDRGLALRLEPPSLAQRQAGPGPPGPCEPVRVSGAVCSAAPDVPPGRRPVVTPRLTAVALGHVGAPSQTEVPASQSALPAWAAGEGRQTRRHPSAAAVLWAPGRPGRGDRLGPGLKPRLGTALRPLLAVAVTQAVRVSVSTGRGRPGRRLPVFTVT